MEDKNDHDVLIETHTVVKRIEKWCCNHDKHHQAREKLAWSVLAGLVVSLVLLLLSK